METAGGPPAGLRGGAWAESPGLSAAPGARSPCPSRRAARRGPPGRTCHSPRSRARRERGRGRGASFLSETYGIRQEFGPPRFKKTNKGKIVREGPPRAAGPTHCPPRSPPGRPGLPAGAEPQVGGASPGWSPGGLPCPGPWLTRHPPLSRAEKAPGGQGKKGSPRGASPTGITGVSPCLEANSCRTPARNLPKHPSLQATFGGEISTAQVALGVRALPPLSHPGFL